MQRSSVDFPEPLGPMIATTAAFDPQRYPFEYLHCAERLPEIGDLDHVA
jgi:hypothetical protein